jgi:transcriptional regulator with XRE-family HTH domain
VLANALAKGHRAVMPDSELAGFLATNLKQLRLTRGLTQQQLARASGIPRATWANLESGAANPTLAVLHAAAVALQVSVEELLSPPRAAARFYPRGSLPTRQRGQATMRKLLPDRIAGMEIDRMELQPGARIAGVPHTPGTREYLTCESGEIVLTASGSEHRVGPGDVVVFAGHQKHGYANPGTRPAIGYSVVVLAPAT